MTDRLYLDIENNGDELICVGWAKNTDPVQVTDYWPVEITDPEWTKVTQSGHDLRFAKLGGVDVQGPWHDTMVMAWVLDENQPLDQESLTKRYVGYRYKVKSITQRANRLYFATNWPLDEWRAWPAPVLRKFREYCANDVGTLRLLYEQLFEGLDGGEWLDYWRREEVPYSNLILDMEVRGLPINLEACDVLTGEVRDLRNSSLSRLQELSNLPAGFNFNSPDQLRLYLFNKWFTLPGRMPVALPEPLSEVWETHKVGTTWRHGVWKCRGRGLAPTPPPRRKQGAESKKPSTATPELLYKHGRDEFVQVLCLEYRRYVKLLGTYLEKFPHISREGRIYGRFNQTGTVTGRLSSSQPNLQNIPARRELGKRVRGLFQGQFVIGDYDALEMRILAHLSGDPRLLSVFRDGQDPHALTAQAIWGYLPDHDDPKRDQGKTMNYAIAYQAGPITLAKSMALAGYPTTQTEAKGYIKAVEDFYPRLFRYINQKKWQAKQSGGVSTLGGRRRRVFPDRKGMADWKAVAYGERQAVNAEVQGSAADIFRRTLLQAEKWVPELKLLAQVHDEAIWQYDTVPTPERLAFLQRLMETGHGLDLKVPLVFEPKVCHTWADKGTGTDLEEIVESLR